MPAVRSRGNIRRSASSLKVSPIVLACSPALPNTVTKVVPPRPYSSSGRPLPPQHVALQQLASQSPVDQTCLQLQPRLLPSSRRGSTNHGEVRAIKNFLVPDFIAITNKSADLQGQMDAINGAFARSNESTHARSKSPFVQASSDAPNFISFSVNNDQPANTSELIDAGSRSAFPQDDLAHGHAAPTPVNDKTPPSQRFMPTSTALEADKTQVRRSPDQRMSTPTLNADLHSPAVSHSQSAESSMILVATHGEGAAVVGTDPTATPKTGGNRRNKKYLLPDGSVVSGKGLGRGRPGIKRGPRKSQTGDETSSQVGTNESGETVAADSVTSGKKRKSTTSDTSTFRANTVDSVMSDSVESVEEYNPTGHTRSGRQTQKPALVSTSGAASASPARGLSRHNSTTNGASNSPASVKTHPKIKRRVYRGREQFALCEHCLRGHGPPGNAIVFCDACNKCWHQRCHEPQISKQTVTDSTADWFCSECDRILHGKRKEKKTNGKGGSQTSIATAPVVPPPPTYAGALVGGRFLQAEQKLAYLNTLSKEDLVARLIHSANLAPDLPIFQTLVPPPPPPAAMPQAQFTSTYVTPVSKVPFFENKDVAHEREIDEGYDGYFDEHAALYPKPGHGLRLPPESEDMHMLLEGKDSTTFSHKVYNRR
jgi:hypothetical protein